jgi:hypothetical protein
MIGQLVRPDNLCAWLRVNAAASLTATGGDYKQAWRHYLAANSGVGTTTNELEWTYLNAQAAAGVSIEEKWNSFLNPLQSGSSITEKARKRYQ